MTPSARIQAVIELLHETAATPRPADGIVSHYFRNRRYIGSKDRAAVAAQFYAIMRHQGRMQWWLNKAKIENATARAITIAYLSTVEEKTLGEINTLFDGKKFAPKPLTEPERKLLEQMKGHTAEHPNMPDVVKVECPYWAADSLKKRFGKNFAKELRALLEPAPLDIRVNTLKTTREEMLAALQKLNIEAEACKLSPWGIRIKGRPSLNALPMLKEGLIEIQDEGSQLIALIADAKPGQRVVDFCAGAGGKTLAMAAQMNNKGRIVACDVLAGRLKRSGERFRRAGIHNVEIKPLSTENDPWVKRHKTSFDRVLVDAPCSGTGAWRRNPDSRWRTLGPGMEKLLVLQNSILESAARLVKPKGILIYATCSLLPEENEAQVEKFLEAHKEFKLKDCGEFLGESAKGPYLSLTPAQNETDGFFGALMERIG